MIIGVGMNASEAMRDALKRAQIEITIGTFKGLTADCVIDTEKHDAALLQGFAQWLWDKHFLVDEAFTLRLVDMYRKENGDV